MGFSVLFFIHLIYLVGKVTKKREKSEKKDLFSFLFRVSVSSAIAKVTKKRPKEEIIEENTLNLQTFYITKTRIWPPRRAIKNIGIIQKTKMAISLRMP
jgi:hypothetical protein